MLIGTVRLVLFSRCGSVIVDFQLRFNQSVRADDVISALKTAVRQGKFGNFSVDTNSIEQRKPRSSSADAGDTSTQDTSTQDTSTQDTRTQGYYIVVLLRAVLLESGAKLEMKIFNPPLFFCAKVGYLRMMNKNNHIRVSRCIVAMVTAIDHASLRLVF